MMALCQPGLLGYAYLYIRTFGCLGSQELCVSFVLSDLQEQDTLTRLVVADPSRLQCRMVSTVIGECGKSMSMIFQEVGLQLANKFSQ